MVVWPRTVSVFDKTVAPDTANDPRTPTLLDAENESALKVALDPKAAALLANAAEGCKLDPKAAALLQNATVGPVRTPVTVRFEVMVIVEYNVTFEYA